MNKASTETGFSLRVIGLSAIAATHMALAQTQNLMTFVPVVPPGSYTGFETYKMGSVGSAPGVCSRLLPHAATSASFFYDYLTMAQLATASGATDSAAYGVTRSCEGALGVALICGATDGTGWTGVAPCYWGYPYSSAPTRILGGSHVRGRAIDVSAVSSGSGGGLRSRP